LGELSIFLKTCCKKNPSKIIFYEKVKMLKKDPFVVDSFVIVVLFDGDCTRQKNSNVNDSWLTHLACWNQG
jgi:uncharacterized lipoprotein YajG